MNVPVKGAGFGSFSRILGPWTDYNPVQKLPADSQIGVALGTEIVGGTRGATVTSITVSPPANVAGTFATIPFRLLAFRGFIPADLEQIQQALQGMPRNGATSLSGVGVLFEYVIAAQLSANNATSGNTQQLHFPFPDLGGPSVGAGEPLSVLLAMLNNETGIPGYGANNQTFASITVAGVYDRRVGGAGDIDTRGRSIPRGRLSGI